MVEKVLVNIEELRSGGVVELREKDMFSIWVKTACSNLTVTQLRKLAGLAEEYGRGYLLFSTRQIPIIPFVSLKDVAEVKKQLGNVYLELDRCGPRVRNINVCYEDKVCPDAITNSLSLAEKLDNFFHRPLTKKLKIGVAGCKKDCIVSRVLSDIAFVGVAKGGTMGYDVYVGGRLGVNPSVGIRMAECLQEEECVKVVDNCFDLLDNEGREGERYADLIARLGADRVEQELKRGLHDEVPIGSIECTTSMREEMTNKLIIRVRATLGEVTSKQLRVIANIAEKYGMGFVHFAVRGSPEIPCVDSEHLESIRRELGEVNMRILDTGIDNLQTCYGSYCTETLVDTQSLLRGVEQIVQELEIDNLTIKISAAGCPNSCGIAHLNDIGFYGVAEPEVDLQECTGCGLCLFVCKRKAITIQDYVAAIDENECRHCGHCITVCPYDAMVEMRRGFAVLMGGSEGEDTRLGELIGEFYSEDEALQITKCCLRILNDRNSSAALIIDEMGLEKFREVLFSDLGWSAVT